jgi:hypothetical protein
MLLLLGCKVKGVNQSLLKYRHSYHIGRILTDCPVHSVLRYLISLTPQEETSPNHWFPSRGLSSRPERKEQGIT